MDTSSKSDPEGCDESDDGEAVSLSGKVTETSEQDKEAGRGDADATLPRPAGGKGEISRFQGK